MPEPLDAGALLAKHRAKGVLVDTNLLVLFLIGSVNKRLIPTSKRTQDFTVQDYDPLVRLIAWFGNKLIATPHVLSQVSDLTRLPGKELDSGRILFKTIVEQNTEECYDHSRILVNSSVFKRLGLADAGIATVCARGTVVLTTDLDLYLALQAQGIDALNFNHLRALEW